MSDTVPTNTLTNLTVPASLSCLSDDQLIKLSHLWQEQTYPAGVMIFNEGEQSDEIYFLIRGDIAIVKWDEKHKQKHQLQVLSGEQVFGDVSFLTNAPRSAGVQAVTEVTAIKLSRKVLAQNHPEAKQIEHVLDQHIAIVNMQRLQKSNKQYVRNLEAQIADLQERLEFGGFLGMTIAVFTIIALVSRYITTADVAFDATSLNFLFVFGSALAVPVVYFIIQHRHPRKDLGLVWGDWPRGVLESLAITALIAALVAVTMWVDRQFFDNQLLGLNLDWRRFSLISAIIYWISSFGQELLARGIIQGSMQRLLRDTRGIQTIFLSSAIFAIMHINYGFVVIAITFLASLLFGYMYWRHKSLLGVTIVHGLLGVIASLVGILPP